jgi:hypothetical protein
MAFGSQPALPMDLPASAASEVAAISPDNPATTPPQDQWMQLGLSKEDIDQTVKIIAMYRNQWGADRLLRSKDWMRSVLFYRGIQVIDWNADSSSWVDGLSWYEGGGGSNKVRDGESTDLRRFIHPLTLLLGQTFIGNMSREVPKTIVKPQDARVLADMTTATAAQDAIGIIERRNHIRQMVRGEFEFLYLYGTYFKWTRGALDGNDSGWDEQPILGEVTVDLPDRMRCMSCGTETPVDQMAPDANAGMSCPACGKPMGQDSFYPSEPGKPRIAVVGMQKIPRAMVKQTIHSPLEIDCDPEAKTLAGTPLLAYSFEMDIGEARMMFPDAWDKIHEGAEDTTSDNSSYDRLRRNESYAMGSGYTTDVAQQRPTYSQIWLNPMAYNRTGDRAYADRMNAAAPGGIKLTLLGGEVVGVKKSILTKEWTLGRLHEREGIYCQSIAQNVTSFNERFNNAMFLYDDWMMRAACGLNLIDASMIDEDKWKGNTLAPATVIPVPTKFGGTQKTLANAFLHFDIPVNPALGLYPSMLLNFAQMLNGLPAQLMGNGTQPGVETLGGQQIQQDAGNTGIAPFWENVKDEHSEAAQNAIECLQELLKCGAAQEISEVIQDEGSQFRQNYVNLQKMQGRVKVNPDEDQDLPQSPVEVRKAFQTLFEELTKGNPAAQAIFDVPVNQEVIGSVLFPNVISPVSAQRAKTLQDLSVLLEATAEPVMNPDGSIGTKLPVEPSIMEQFEYAIPTCQEWYIENADMRIKNPVGYSQVEQYFGMLQDMQTAQQSKGAVSKGKVQLAGQMASQPPAAGPDPQTQAVVAELQRLAAGMADQLSKLAQIDPGQTGGTITGQVSAAKEVVEASIDAERLMAGGK